MDNGSNSKLQNTAASRADLLHKHDKGYRASGNWHFLVYLLGLFAVVLAIRAFVFEPIRVDGVSMCNTLQDQEYCFAERASYWFTSPKQGDIVIVYYSKYDETYGRARRTYVKRVIATAGQTVKIMPSSDKGNGMAVYVDGVELDESAYSANFMIDENRVYTSIQPGAGGECYSYDVENSTYECTVPEGCVFVMGDHRTDSHDSRSPDVGPIPLHDVIGRVRIVINSKERSIRTIG